MIFLDRRKKAGGSFLQWRMGLFLVGAVVGLAGMARDSRVLVGVAIGILAVAVGLRFAGPDPEGEEGWTDDGGEDET